MTSDRIMVLWVFLGIAWYVMLGPWGAVAFYTAALGAIYVVNRGARL